MICSHNFIVVLCKLCNCLNMNFTLVLSIVRAAKICGKTCGQLMFNCRHFEQFESAIKEFILKPMMGKIIK